MKALHSLAIAAALLVACSSTPAPPEWQANAHQALKNFETAYLEGNTRVANVEFARARAEASATGRPDVVARLELARCGVQTASLAFDDCPGFKPLEVDADAQERAYADYLAGRWQGLDPNRLPVQHRPVVTAGTLPADPLARLVAAGALLRAERITPAAIAAAIEAASANGWRRPLLAWLGVEEKRATSAGDAESVARIRRRIELITRGGR